MSQEPIPELFRQRIQAAKEQQLEELDLSYDFELMIVDYFFSSRNFW